MESEQSRLPEPGVGGHRVPMSARPTLSSRSWMRLDWSLVLSGLNEMGRRRSGGQYDRRQRCWKPSPADDLGLPIGTRVCFLDCCDSLGGC